MENEQILTKIYELEQKADEIEQLLLIKKAPNLSKNLRLFIKLKRNLSKLKDN